MKKSDNNSDILIDNIPMGLEFGLSSNPNAMKRFYSLDDQSKQRIINKAKNVNSKSQMRNIISNIGNGNMDFFN